ncbi:MAG: hypothetical protein EOP87_08015, partial [Verrucomicrobiaceae bacterium]
MKKILRALFIVLFLFTAGYTIFSLYSKNRISATRSADRTSHEPVRNGPARTGRIEAAQGAKTSPDIESVRSRIADPATAPESLDLAEAEKLLEQYKKEVTDVISHAEFASELVATLCRNGHSADAWEFIEKNPGQMRGMQLREFFKNGDVVKNELLARLSGFEDRMDLKRGLEGYLLRIKPSEYADVIASPDIRRLQESLGTSPNDALREALDSFQTDLMGRRYFNPPDESVVRDYSDALKDMDAKGLIEKGDFRALVLSSQFGPFFQWDLLKNHATTVDELPENQRNGLVGRMLIKNPTRAMDVILAMPSAGNAENVDAAIREWIGVDSHAAVKWHTQNRGNYDPAQQDLLASAFSK